MRAVVLMDRVGGYSAYLRLLEDAHMLDLVAIALRGEAEAARESRLESEAKARANRAKTRAR